MNTPATSTDFWKDVTKTHRQNKEDFAKKEGVDKSVREQVDSDWDKMIDKAKERE